MKDVIELRISTSILLLFTLLLVVLIPNHSFSEERAETFIIYAMDDKFKVVSPPAYSSNFSIIIDNKTLTTLVVQLVKKNSSFKKIKSIESGKYERVNMTKYKRSDELTLIPLSPAFQEVELIFGKKSYEIPPKNKI
jgi:hypothetical protein